MSMIAPLSTKQQFMRRSILSLMMRVIVTTAHVARIQVSVDDRRFAGLLDSAREATPLPPAQSHVSSNVSRPGPDPRCYLHEMLFPDRASSFAKPAPHHPR